jgi:purine-binding chemotaxis protein CheW
MNSRPTERALVGFDVGAVSYALPIERVREIIRPLPMQTLPHAPAMVVGVVDHRGHVVTIIDLRVRFEVGYGEQTGPARWLIVNRGPRLLGLVVDRVNEVFKVQDAEARNVPELGAGSAQRAITAAYSHHGRLLFVVDVDRITNVVDELQENVGLLAPEAG